MNKIISHARMATETVFLLFVVITMFNQCSSAEYRAEEHIEYKKELSSTLYGIKDIDSLLIALEDFIKQDDDIGKMLCYKQLGLRQRESARFSDAINSHQQGLDIAIKLNDTIEIVQAMNNLGTNFRRIGAHSEASQYHFQALHYAEAWSEKDTDRKSVV